MSNDEAPNPRAYQRLLIDQANAEMGRQRVSRREISRMTGIPRTVVDRLFLCERDMSVRQWDAIATALGFDPGELARKARAAGDEGPAGPGNGRSAPPPTVVGQSGIDVRTTITQYLDNPDQDPTLTARLGDVAGHPGVSGEEMARLGDTIRRTRREELMHALAALPPDDERRQA